MSVTVTVDSTVLAKVKTAIPLASDDTDLNTEITDLIQEAVNDLIPADVTETVIDLDDPLILKAVKTYVKLNFGEPVDYDRLLAAYNGIKAQLSMDHRYTEF